MSRKLDYQEGFDPESKKRKRFQLVVHTVDPQPQQAQQPRQPRQPQQPQQPQRSSSELSEGESREQDLDSASDVLSDEIGGTSTRRKSLRAEKAAEADDSASPPNYRWAELPQNSCAVCSYFRSGNYCSRYDQPVDASATCDAFTAKVETAQKPPDLGTEFLPSPQEALQAVEAKPEFFGKVSAAARSLVGSAGVKDAGSRPEPGSASESELDSELESELESESESELEKLAFVLDPDNRPAEGLLVRKLREDHSPVFGGVASSDHVQSQSQDQFWTVQDMRLVLSSLSSLSSLSPLSKTAQWAQNQSALSEAGQVAQEFQEFQERCLRIERAFYDPILSESLPVLSQTTEKQAMDRFVQLAQKFVQVRLSLARKLLGYAALD